MIDPAVVLGSPETRRFYRSVHLTYAERGKDDLNLRSGSDSASVVGCLLQIFVYPHLYPDAFKPDKNPYKTNTLNTSSNDPGPPLQRKKTSTDVFFCAWNPVNTGVSGPSTSTDVEEHPRFMAFQMAFQAQQY